MTNKISEEDVQDTVAQVKHPAIDCTLVELGIIREVTVKDRNVVIIMAFPFPNIPIGDILVNSVKEALDGLDAEVEVETAVMDERERKRFLAMEQKNWRKDM